MNELIKSINNFIEKEVKRIWVKDPRAKAGGYYAIRGKPEAPKITPISEHASKLLENQNTLNSMLRHQVGPDITPTGKETMISMLSNLDQQAKKINKIVSGDMETLKNKGIPIYSHEDPTQDISRARSRLKKVYEGINSGNASWAISWLDKFKKDFDEAQQRYEVFSSKIRAMKKSYDLLEKSKIYLKPGETPSGGQPIQEGKRGGKFYVTSGKREFGETAKKLKERISQYKTRKEAAKDLGVSPERITILAQKMGLTPSWGTYKGKEKKEYKHVCKNCGKEFILASHEETKRKTHRFCSKKCQGEWLGKKHGWGIRK